MITALEMVTVLVNGSYVPASNDSSMLSALSTEGGEIVQISGQNFGPSFPRSYISSVWYGNAVGSLLAMSQCWFEVPHTTIQCVTVPGAGFGYNMQVRVFRVIVNSVCLSFLRSRACMWVCSVRLRYWVRRRTRRFRIWHMRRRS